MKFFLTIALIGIGIAQAQEIKQTVKGKVTDGITGIPLTDISIQIFNTAASFEDQTDEAGNFSVEVPVGRYKIKAYRTGYEIHEQELLVISGREAVVNIALGPAIQTLNPVEVTASALPADIPGLRSLSIEKTLRVPANFFDPVRVVTAYPGVVSASDQNNSIIVRGNSPNGLLWRLNGLDIVNPNHLANAGTLSDKPMANGGGVNILSAQMLDRTDFYTGAFPANYGNALSGIIDMKLRNGNTGKHEYTAQASLIGLDLAAEGPISKEKSSYLVNYRYSTVGLLSALGVNLGDEAISFQDLSFNTDFQQKNGGNFSLFGFLGNSKNDFKAKDAVDWEEDKDKYNITYSSAAYMLGLNYKVPLGNGKFFIGLAYSNSDQERTSGIMPEFIPPQRNLLTDDYKTGNSLLSGTIKYEIKTSERGAFEVGIMTNQMNNSVSTFRSFGCVSCGVPDNQFLSGSTDGLLLQPYVNFNYGISSAIDLNGGVRYLNYTFNNASAIEPRIGLNFKTSEVSGFNLAYSLVSQLQLPQVYVAPGNEDLGFTKSHHVDVSYHRSFTNNVNLKTGAFYQNLFDVPVEADPSSTFSTINLLEGFAPNNLVNEGSGENYGVDFTIEKLFYSRHYFLIGGSYYESTYKGGDGVKRDTRFNGNYTASAVYGKEWVKPEKNRTIGLNMRFLYLGGLRQSSVDITNSESNGETVYNNFDPFSEKLKDYYRLDLRLSFRKNKARYTRTFALDIQNLTSQQNEAYRYYDFTQQKIVTKFQLGIIPILVYRIDF